MAGGHQAIPHLPRDIGSDIELPAQLADVGHALGEDVESVDPDVASLHEWEAVLRDIVLAAGLQHRARLRPPHSNHA